VGYESNLMEQVAARWRKIKTVLVVGAKGMLGREVALALRQPQWQVDGLERQIYCVDVDQVDVARADSAKNCLLYYLPELVINCAAYTDVDGCELNPQKAKLLNTQSVEMLIEKFDGKFVQISTDYIFDGKKGAAYTELDEPHPQSKYAHSKFIGEQAIHTANPKSAIIRTSWLYSEYAHNFVKTIRKLAEEKDELRIIKDQVGTPTYAGDLESAIINILPELNNFNGVNTYNYSNEGITNWAEFAEAIIDYSGLDCKVIPVTTEEYGLTKAARPAFSLLDKTKIKEEFKISIPDWRDSLKKCISNLEKNTKHE